MVEIFNNNSEMEEEEKKEFPTMIFLHKQQKHISSIFMNA